MSEIKVVIYGICHPETNLFYYIGQTINLESRKRHHLNYSKNNNLKKFFSALNERSLEPKFIVVDSCNQVDSIDVENHYIKHYLDSDHPLTNKRLKQKSKTETIGIDILNKQVTLHKDVIKKLEHQAKEAGFPNFKNYTEWILINHSKQAK